jgi:hypothetical protein
VLNLLKDKGLTRFTVDQLDRYMQNIGRGEFNYETFKAAYDSDEKIKNLVKDFDQNTITLKTRELDDINPTASKKKDTVAKMAKKATNLGS